jgi:LysR family transcriptional activator of nhaA
MPAESNVKAISHRLGRSSLAIFGADCFHSGSKAPFPACLDGLPMLMPGSGSALRRKLDGWIGETSLSPRVVGEFDDWALMMTFGREGNGVFAAPAVLETQLLREHGVRPLGHLANVFDEFYAISIERNISHPSVHRIADAARGKQFEDARQLAH